MTDSVNSTSSVGYAWNYWQETIFGKEEEKREKPLKPKILDNMRDGRSYVGVTLGSKIPSTREANEFQFSTGTRVAAVSWFYKFDPDPNADYVFPVESMNQIYANGSIPTMTWEPDPIGAPRDADNNILREIMPRNMEGLYDPNGTGKHDAYIRAFARAAAKWKHEFIIRFAHEMNGNWYPWGGMPEEYKAAFRHIWKIFREEGATNVLFAWAPDAGQLANIEAYYPGDEYVDIIGFSGYNKAVRTKNGSYAWQSCEDIFQAAVNKFKGKGKPLAIFEFGIDDEGERINDKKQKGRDKASWLQEAYAWMKKNKIALSAYFNMNKLEDLRFRVGTENETTIPVLRFWALNSDTDQIAFQSAVNDDFFIRTILPNHSQQIEGDEIVKFLQRLLTNWKFYEDMVDFTHTSSYDRAEFDLWKMNHDRTRNSIETLFGNIDVILHPARYVGSPKLEKVSQQLLNIADALTSLEKYEEAVLVYSLVPKEEAVFAFRRMAIVGIANAISFRGYEGDKSRSLGLFNYARHLFDDNWQRFDIFGKVSTNWILPPGDAGNIAGFDLGDKWLRDDTSIIRLPQRFIDDQGTELKPGRKRISHPVARTEIPTNEFDKVKELFMNPAATNLEFKPGVSNDDIDRLNIPADLKNLLHQALGPARKVLMPKPLRANRPNPQHLDGWKYVDDMLLMSSVQIGLGASYSYLSNWDTAYDFALPYFDEGLRLWGAVGRRPYKMLPIEPATYLAFAQLWSRKDFKFSAEKLINLAPIAKNDLRVFTGADTDALWDYLVTQKYLNEHGAVLSRFTGEIDDFAIDPSFNNYRAQTFKVLLKAYNQDHDPLNICDLIRDYASQFEDRGFLEIAIRTLNLKSHWLHYPAYLLSGADLVEADILSRSSSTKHQNRAIELCWKVLRKSPVIAQRARAYYLLARTSIGLKLNPLEAQAYCDRAMAMLKNRPELDATKIGIRLLRAEIDGLATRFDKAIDELIKLEALLREYPPDDYLKEHTVSLLIDYFRRSTDPVTREKLERYLFSRLKTVLIREIDQNRRDLLASVRSDIPGMTTTKELLEYARQHGVELKKYDIFDLIITINRLEME